MSEDLNFGRLDPTGSGDDPGGIVRRIQTYLDQLRQRDEPLAVNNEDWDRFYRMYLALFQRLVRRRHWSTEDYEDSIQDLWLLLITRLPALRYEPCHDGIDAWVSVVAKNRLVDHDRYRSNHSMKRLSVEAADHLTGREPDPALAFAQNHITGLVQDALAELQARVSARDYEAFILHWFEGLSVREVARRLGRTEAEVWSSNHRLSEELRPILQRQLAPGELR